MRRIASLAVFAAALCGVPAAHAADPTAQELHFLYELNRARHDPPAWASFYGLGAVTGGNGQPADLATVPPRPPLAWNPELTDSSRFKATEIATYDYSGHQSTIGPNYYWPQGLARSFGYPLPETVPDGAGGYYFFPDGVANFIESLARGYGPNRMNFSLGINALIALIVDSGGLGHRVHLLGMSGLSGTFAEIGAGYALNPSGTFRNYWAIHTGVRETPQLLLTGVAFADGNANTLFDPGEGVAGVTVQAGATSVVTGAAGNYSLLVADGGHAVTCSGGGFSGSAAGWAEMDGTNHQLDCISGNAVAWLDFEPAPAPEATAFGAALAAAGALAALVRRRR